MTIISEFKRLFRGEDTAASLMIKAKRENRDYIEPVRGDRAQAAAVIFGGEKTAAGVRVNETQSLSISAVYACVRVLSESISSLPLKVFERSGDSRQAAMMHPLYNILHLSGNDIMTAMKMRELMVVHLLLWGNSYSEIERDRGGRIVALWPIHPGRVQVKMIKMNGLPRLVYLVSKADGGTNELDQDRVLHVAGMGTGVMGKSPIRMHRESLGTSIAAQRYGAKFFANDARPGFVLSHPGVMGEDGFKNFKDSWNQIHQGTDNAHRVAILEEGMKPEQIGIPPRDAQFIETRKFEKSEIAAIFRVPPHLIGDLDRATYSNIEQQGIEFVMHSLRPWLVRIEQAINVRCLSETERARYYAEHNVAGLLRGDLSTRYTAYATGRQWGWLSADDIRAMENMNPLPGDQGTTYLQPMNMVSADASLQADETNARAVLPGHNAGIETRAEPPRVSSAMAIQPVYLDVFRRIVRREIGEIKKAITTYLEGGDVEGFRSWLLSFAEDHATWMNERLLPVFETMAETMVREAVAELDAEIEPGDIAEFLADYTEAAANRHAGSMRGQVESLLDEEDARDAVLTRLDEWDETRADKAARRERERSSNAFTKAAWIVAGIASITWRTAGEENCPMCEAMEGRSTSISLPFLESGVNIAGLITTGTVGHPPLHDGCDCYLEADIERERTQPNERRELLDTLIQSIRKTEHEDSEERRTGKCCEKH